MRAIVIVGLVVSTAGPAYSGQDPLDTAKDLYASAAYEESLSMLIHLANGAAPDVVRQVNQYRAYCLFALGRTAEAEQLVEALIRKDPFAALNDGEMSPRIKAMFTSVRKRLVPALIREEYRIARSAIEGKDLARAEPHLIVASRLLAEARTAGAVDEMLADLSVLVDGFLGLVRAEAGQPPARVAAKEAEGAPALSANAPPTVSSAGAASIYSGVGDSRLSPPVTVSQMVPDLPPALARELVIWPPRTTLVLDLVINETGDVQEVVVAQGAQLAYDQFLLKAARQWKFRPATFDGVPVKFRTSVPVAFRGQ